MTKEKNVLLLVADKAGAAALVGALKEANLDESEMDIKIVVSEEGGQPFDGDPEGSILIDAVDGDVEEIKALLEGKEEDRLLAVIVREIFTIPAYPAMPFLREALKPEPAWRQAQAAKSQGKFRR